MLWDLLSKHRATSHPTQITSQPREAHSWDPIPSYSAPGVSPISRLHSLHITSFPHTHPMQSGPYLLSTSFYQNVPAQGCSYLKGPMVILKISNGPTFTSNKDAQVNQKAGLDGWRPWCANAGLSAQSEMLTVRKTYFCLHKIYILNYLRLQWVQSVTG